MAQTKKKGLIARMIEGKEKSEGYARAHLPSNRWQLFWDIFKGRFGKLFLINLLMILFLLPIIFLLFLRSQMAAYNTSIEPIGQSIGIGYPAIPVLIGRAEAVAAASKLSFYLFLPICSMIGSLGLAGGFYVIRNMVWTEGIFVANDFWRGIKQNYFQIMITAFIYSVFLGITSYVLSLIDMMMVSGTGSAALWVICKILLYVFIGFFTIVAMWTLSMCVTYKLKYHQLLKNAILMTVALLPNNLFFLFLGAIPLILFLIGGFFTIIAFIMLVLFGFSLLALVWTDYSHWVFDRFINDHVPGAEKNRGIYEKVKEDDAESVRQYKMQVREIAKSHLTSTPIKPITDKELHLEELPTTFNRNDLKRLAASKEALVRDHEEYVEKHRTDEKYLKMQQELQEIEAEERAAMAKNTGKKAKKAKPLYRDK